MEGRTAGLEATKERTNEAEELRLALSMRGGVSLAVWIGGAVAEIEAMRAASGGGMAPSLPITGTGAVYARLLSQARYDHVTVDILTGASAGGLNGAIYAASLMYGFDFGRMAELWLQVADIEALCRPTRWTPGEEQRPSLFEGDEYFWAICRGELRKLIDGSAEARSQTPEQQRLDLFLAATLAKPVERILRNDAFSRIAETRSSAFFHFRHLGTAGSALSDFDRVTKADDADDIANRLALAGRSTSSFPIAFEPATVWSDPAAPSGARSTGLNGYDGPNMAGVFSEVTGDEPVGVIDGGVLDNIPVGRAIQAIAGAPAAGAASRWLLYLHPSPPEDNDGASDGENLTGILAGLKRSFQLKFSSESLVEDMVALEEHNADVADRRMRREVLLTHIAGATELSAVAAWAQADAKRVREVLLEPDLAMATHPFAASGFGAVLDGWDASLRSALFDRLPDALAADSAPSPAPLLALGDVVESLLTLTQQTHNVPDQEATLYRIRLLIEVLTAVWDRCWAESAQHPPSGIDDLDRWLDDAMGTARQRSEMLPSPLVAMLISGLKGDTDAADYHAVLAAIDATTSLSDRSSLAEVWQLTMNQAEAIYGQTAALSDPVAQALAPIRADDPMTWQGLVWATAPLHRRVLSGESAIRFLRVSGAARSPFEGWFTGGRDGLSVTEKLAGNQLLNFGAFFSARWRANDWMWGRLDSATSLVDLLCDTTRWFPSSGTENANTTAEIAAALITIERAVTSPFAVDSDTWARWRTAEWSEHRGVVEAEITAASADPGIAHELPVTKEVVTRRLHAELFAELLPFVEGAPAGSAPAPAPPHEPLVSIGETQQIASRLRAGAERVPDDIEPKRWARIGMRVGLNAWLALRPSSQPARVLSSLLKPVFVFVLSVLVYPHRALVAGIVGISGLLLGRWGDPSTPAWPWSGEFVTSDAAAGDYWTWQKGVTGLVVAALIAVLAWVMVRGAYRQGGKAVAVIGGGVGVAALVLAAMDVSLAPAIVPVCAILVVAIGMHWMHWKAWLGCFLVAIVPYVALWFVVRAWDAFTPGWWVIASFAGAVIGTTAYVTLVDVFPARPRPEMARGQR